MYLKYYSKRIYFRILPITYFFYSKPLRSIERSLARDWVRPPVPTSWFPPHAGVHLATALFRSQERGRGTRYRPLPPPRRLSLHSGDFWKVFCFSDNCMDNIDYCLMFLSCLHSAPRLMLILANWTEGQQQHRIGLRTSWMTAFNTKKH